MSYASFAAYYDSLTHNVGYRERAEYLCTLLKRLGHSPGLTLDLACGTGSLTLELAKRGWDIYGADASAEMLNVAQQKAADAGLSLLFLHQKMQELDLYGTVDTVVCALDSVNHLSGERDLLAAFKKVSLFLNPGGYFIFDLNTVYKHKHVLANNVFIYDTEEVFCAWQNHFEPTTDRVLVELDFFAKEGGAYRRSSESFYERAYPMERVNSLLKEAELETTAIYGDLTFDAPLQTEERVVLVARKPLA